MTNSQKEKSGSLKTIGIIIILLSILILIFSIFLLIMSNSGILNEDFNLKLYNNLPIAYKIFLNLLFRHTIIFSLFLISFSILNIFISILFLKSQIWARKYLEIMIWITGIIVFFLWMNFLFFVFNVNLIVPDLNLKGVKLLIYQIGGFIISLIHILLIIPIYKTVRLLRNKEIKSLF